MKIFIAAVSLLVLCCVTSCKEGNNNKTAQAAPTPVKIPSVTASTLQEGTKSMTYKVQKSEEEWKALLTPEQYHVAREKGTERAFTGAYWNSKKEGVYLCVCCKQELFDSKTKFDSGTGWPSYWQPVKEENIHIESDTSHGMVRTEVLCSNCGAHLGHVFNDGPAPTGLRYCINSASLQLKER